MKHIFIIICFGLLSSASLLAQKEINMDSGPSFKERIYTGGGIGFSSGSYSTYLTLSPTIGYMLDSKTSVGVGVTYQYYKDKVYNAEDHRYGGDIFLLRMIVGRVFVMGQYSLINMNRFPSIETNPRETFKRFLLGGGVSQPIGRAFLNFTALYDISYALDNNSSNYPYSSPWVIGAFISI